MSDYGDVNDVNDVNDATRNNSNSRFVCIIVNRGIMERELDGFFVGRVSRIKSIPTERELFLCVKPCGRER